MYLNPRPTKKYIGQFYPTESYWNDKVDPIRAYGYLYNLIFKDRKKRKILDIGAGNGLFLTEFKKRGWKTVGVEFSDHAVRQAKKFGLKLKRGDFLDYKFPSNSFDVVTLNNVLEHLFKPQETLEKISKVIKKDGILVITVPNIESIGFQFFKRDWYGVDAPRHLYQFSLDTLGNMLSDCGFEVTKVFHGYWQHNYPILFESFRIRFSLTSKRKAEGVGKEGLVGRGRFSLDVFGVKVICWFVAKLEPLVKRSEVVVLAARKI